jgi:hypothetical protein
LPKIFVLLGDSFIPNNLTIPTFIVRLPCKAYGAQIRRQQGKIFTMLSQDRTEIEEMLPCF